MTKSEYIKRELNGLSVVDDKNSVFVDVLGNEYHVTTPTLFGIYDKGLVYKAFVSFVDAETDESSFDEVMFYVGKDEKADFESAFEI